MALGIDESAISSAGVFSTSDTVNLSIQPDSGQTWIVATGVFFPGSSSNHTVSAPTGLTSRQDIRAGGSVSAWLQTKTSSGSDGTAATVNITPDSEGLAVWSAVITDGSYDTSGSASDNNNTTLTVTTDASVTSDNSLAIGIFFTESKTNTESMTGWTFRESADTNTASRCNCHVYTKTVNSGSTVSGTFTAGSTNTRIKGFIVVLQPSNVAPTVTAAATDDCVVGVNEDIGAVFTVADTDSNLDTIRYQCAEAHGDITVTLSGAVTITAGTNGTHDLTIGTGSHAELLTVHATAVFNATTEDTQNITVTATDDEALFANDTVAMTSHYLRITNATQAGLNTTLGTGVAVNTDAETAFVDLIAEDSGGRQSTTATTSITTSETIVASGFSRTRRRRRR